ncbi:DUF6304 family protein [Nocardia sp. CA-128927]|uniref:DUF6304 family protein n=1 Tax=Nocardia sp. CA-128927 TaxID=3239975 RepID=UPI003D96C43B
MPAQSFPGSYEDDRGVESVVWRIEPTERYGPKNRRFEIHTVIREIPVWGFYFDDLEPDDAAPGHATVLPLNDAEELHECVLRADLPCTVEVNGKRRPTTVRFTVDLRVKEPKQAPLNQHLAMELDGTTYEAVAHYGLDDGLQHLEATLPAGVRLVCCRTCLYSGYSPYGGGGLIGIRCHREAKTQYLAVRSKHDYLPDLVTEEVPETYLCPEYQRH